MLYYKILKLYDIVRACVCHEWAGLVSTATLLLLVVELLLLLLYELEFLELLCQPNPLFNQLQYQNKQ